MDANKTKFASCVENLWDELFSAVKGMLAENEAVHAVLKINSIEDAVETGVSVGNDGLPKECSTYTLDRFYLYVTSGDNPYDALGPVYLGSGKRIPHPDRNAFRYSCREMDCLSHNVGLRLERLKSLGRDVYFSSDLLGYDKAQVNDSLIEDMLESDDKELGIVG